MKMFGSIQIKQEYPGVEDANQTGNAASQGNSEYPLFTNQDVEYMYRQLPQFWGQAQLQSTQVTGDSTSKNDALVRQDISQMTQVAPQLSAMTYRQHHTMPFQMNQHQQDIDCQPSNNEQQSQSSLAQRETRQGHLTQIMQHPTTIDQASVAVQSTTPTKHNGPGRPPKSSAGSGAGKKLKCQCEICFKEFGHKSNLFIHMRTHNGERPYKCTQCEKCFTHSGNLAIHMRTHSGERPYACQICGKMFSHSGNLSTHLRTHSGVKPYKCSVCAKEFRHSGNLSIHERIHSGIKPFQCKVCGKEFYHSGNLTTHMKKHPSSANSEQCENSGGMLIASSAGSANNVNSIRSVDNVVGVVGSVNNIVSLQNTNDMILVKSEHADEDAASEKPAILTSAPS